jgi:tannase/feruloyl esterase
MPTRLTCLFVLIASLTASVVTGANAQVQNCENLTGMSFPDATITAVVTVPAGDAFTAPNGQTYSVPAFCEVSAVSTPTPDSLINIAIWMPLFTWSGRFEGTGNGGYAGTIALSVPAMISGLNAGSAVASTDMGTAPSGNNDGDALVGHPEKWVDFGWRATHLMTVVSKEIISAFYDAGPKYSYFNGCSTGGQQALMEAQRFPSDYNGILGGDPASNRTHVHTAVAWNYAKMHAAPDSLFTTEQTQAITSAVVAACAVESGGLASDPFLTDPRYCNWDPGQLQCSSTVSTGSCLNADQVEAARLIYQGAIDPVTRDRIFPGSVRGSESDSQFGWVGIASQPEPPFDSLFKWVFGSTWLWPTFDFDQNMAEVDQVLDSDLNANNADLSPFQSAGGKLLMYQGWADPLISPQDLIDYYLRVMAQQGKGTTALKKTQSFYRLFMVPGMYHCAFGPGPNSFGNLFSGQVYAAPPPVEDAEHDALLALQQWVEHGVAPQRIIATKYTDDVPELGIVMQRPICPYPQVPKYSGSGDTNSASNFVCVQDNNNNNPMAAPEYLQ